MPEVHALDLPTCDRLLRSGTFGRFALTSPRGPEIVPVNYAVRDDAVVVRTDPTGTLARFGAGAAVVFEVDAVDPDYWHGFSVIARGVGELVSDPPPPGSGTPTARPWAAGDRSVELRLAWTELTGRQVGGRPGRAAMATFGRAL